MPMPTTVSDRSAHQSKDNANNRKWNSKYEMEQQLRNGTTTKKWNSKSRTVMAIKFKKHQHLSLQNQMQSIISYGNQMAIPCL